MAPNVKLALAATAAVLAFGIPAAASAQDFGIYVGSGGGYYGGPRWGGYARPYYGYDQRAAWYAHERWEHEARERAEWRHRYFEHRRYEGYGGGWRDRY